MPNQQLEATALKLPRWARSKQGHWQRAGGLKLRWLLGLCCWRYLARLTPRAWPQRPAALVAAVQRARPAQHYLSAKRRTGPDGSMLAAERTPASSPTRRSAKAPNTAAGSLNPRRRKLRSSVKQSQGRRGNRYPLPRHTPREGSCEKNDPGRLGRLARQRQQASGSPTRPQRLAAQPCVVTVTAAGR